MAEISSELTPSVPPARSREIAVDPRLSRTMGRYQLLYRFASGGMGDIYLGRLNGEEGFERLVALKVIHEHLSREPEFVKMFIDEARLASRISHPNVALTLDLGRVGQSHFIAMEYVEGESLVALLRRVRPPPPYCARIAADAAAGLHAAHELRDAAGHLLNVVHRDVSPHNILISYNGAVKVVDFGVARARGRLQTTKGTVKGKFSYMAPEQLRSPNSVDRRADVFALGIVLYEMTTWKRLFKGEDEADQIGKVLECAIAPPSRVVDGYPRGLERIVMRALERSPSQRYATALELQEDLEQFILESGEAVLPAAIGKMMASAFPDRIEEKRQLLQNAAAADQEIEATQVSGSSLVLGSAPTLVPRGGRHLLGLAIAGVLVGALVVAAVVYYSYASRRRATTTSASAGPSTRPATPASAPARDARPTTPTGAVTISVRALPESASIELDGQALRNPDEVKRAAADRTVDLVVSAPGHTTQRIKVSLAAGGSFTVALDRSASGKGAVRPKRDGKRAAVKQASHEKKPKKHKKEGVDDDDVLANPYR